MTVLTSNLSYAIHNNHITAFLLTTRAKIFLEIALTYFSLALLPQYYYVSMFFHLFCTSLKRLMSISTSFYPIFPASNIFTNHSTVQNWYFVCFKTDFTSLYRYVFKQQSKEQHRKSFFLCRRARYKKDIFTRRSGISGRGGGLW